MSNDYLTGYLMEIKDPNITFEERANKQLIRGIYYKVIYGSLSYPISRHPHCPCSCSCPDCHVVKNGFKEVSIRLLPLGGYPLILRLKKQKYLCRACGKTFLVESNISDRFCSISRQLYDKLCYDLTKKVSQKDVARDNFVSSNTVARSLARYYDSFNPDFRSLPEHLAFDEFKSTRDAKGSMSFIFVDSDSKRTVDVLESRQLPFLRRYFSNFSEAVRSEVKTVTMDLYSPYMSLVREMFPNARIVVDRFHLVQLFSRSFNQARVMRMKSFSTSGLEYKRLKKYWKLLLKPFDELDCLNYSKWLHFPGRYLSVEDVVGLTIDESDGLKDDYDCYQMVRRDVSLRDFDSFKDHLALFDGRVSEPMQRSINTCLGFLEYLENSFMYEYSNGVLEGINNYIKVLKRVSFGFKRFVNFRTRIFLCRNFRGLEIRISDEFLKEKAG